MFPNTHLYCSKEILKTHPPLFLYGSIFLDIPVIGVISWKELTDKMPEFISYIKDNFPEIKEFARGLMIHENPFGIDRFVHGDEGYAFVKGRKILSDIKKYFEDNYLDTAHSFIEFAVEILLTEKHLEIKDKKRDMLEEIKQYEEEIAEAFSKFFDIEKEIALVSVKEYNDLLNYDIVPRDKAIEFYKNLTNKLRKTNLSEKEIKALLEVALKEVEDDYQGFLDKVIVRCKKDFEENR